MTHMTHIDNIKGNNIQTGKLDPKDNAIITRMENTHIYGEMFGQTNPKFNHHKDGLC